MTRQAHKSNHGDTLETKRINFTECKLAVPEAVADTMEFSGYGAAFGNVDSYGDVIQKGAFSAYLADVIAGKQNWPAMLMQHGGWGVSADDFTPVGVYTDLAEDDFGLKISGQLAPTPRGQEAYALMKMQPRPAISGLSIGYYVREAENGKKSDGYDRLIKQIDVIEISVVTFPANDKARIGDIKSLNDFNEKEFELLLREAGFSRTEAKMINSKGFKYFKNQREAETLEINANIDALQRLVKKITV
jgi:HK97 family phage prohead protease